MSHNTSYCLIEVVTKVKSLYLYDWSVMFTCKTNLINFLLIYIPLIYLSIISVKTCHYKLCIICLFIKSGVKHHIPNSKAGLTRAVLTQGYAGKCPGAPCLSMYDGVYRMFFFLGLNTEIVGNTDTINICLILSTFTLLFL
jgi:hypothetical protein